MKNKNTERNETAFVVGLLAGIFGLWGLAHILNNKIGTGLLWMFIGAPIIMLILGAITFLTAGIGAIIALPLHVYLVYRHARNGASSSFLS